MDDHLSEFYGTVENGKRFVLGICFLKNVECK